MPPDQSAAHTQEQFFVDFSERDLDMSYQNISSLDVEDRLEHVARLVLTGNNLSSLGFINNFVNLEILCIDSCDLSSFETLQLQHFPHLRYLSARLNNFTEFGSLEECDSLEVLDLSLNCFEVNSESTIRSVFGSLKRFKFGFVSCGHVENASHMSDAATNINSFYIFDRIFLQRYYAPENQVHNVDSGNNTQSIIVGGVELQYVIKRSKIYLRATESSDCNGTIVTAYTIAPGYQIEETHQKTLALEDLRAGISLSLEAHFHIIADHPCGSAARTTEQDVRAFELYECGLTRLAERRKLFLVVTVEHGGQVGVIVFDQEGHFHTLKDLIVEQQAQIAAKDGVVIMVQRFGPGLPRDKSITDATGIVAAMDEPTGRSMGEKTPSQPQSLEKPVAQSKQQPRVTIKNGCVQVAMAPFSTIYRSEQTREKLCNEAQQLVAGVRGCNVNGEELLRRAISAFNCGSDRNGVRDNTVVLRLDDAGRKIPLLVQLRRLCVIGTEQYELSTRDARDHYVVVESFGHNVPPVVQICVVPVQYKPISCTELEIFDGWLICRCFRTTNRLGAAILVEVSSPALRVDFYKDNTLMCSSPRQFLDLADIETYHGVYRAVVYFPNQGCPGVQECISNDLFVRRTTNLDEILVARRASQNQKAPPIEELSDDSETLVDKYISAHAELFQNGDGHENCSAQDGGYHRINLKAGTCSDGAPIKILRDKEREAPLAPKTLIKRLFVAEVVSDEDQKLLVHAKCLVADTALSFQVYSRLKNGSYELLLESVDACLGTEQEYTMEINYATMLPLLNGKQLILRALSTGTRWQDTVVLKQCGYTAHQTAQHSCAVTDYQYDSTYDTEISIAGGAIVIEEEYPLDQCTVVLPLQRSESSQTTNYTAHGRYRSSLIRILGIDDTPDSCIIITKHGILQVTFTNTGGLQWFKDSYNEAVGLVYKDSHDCASAYQFKELALQDAEQFRAMYSSSAFMQNGVFHTELQKDVFGETNRIYVNSAGEVVACGARQTPYSRECLYNDTAYHEQRGAPAYPEFTQKELTRGFKQALYGAKLQLNSKGFALQDKQVGLKWKVKDYADVSCLSAEGAIHIACQGRVYALAMEEGDRELVMGLLHAYGANC